MTEPSTELRILRTTVYFDPDTGAIVHVHRIAAAPGDDLDEDRVQQEAAAFEESLEQRHGRELDRIVVDEDDLAASVSPDVNLRVDVTARALTRDGG